MVSSRSSMPRRALMAASALMFAGMVYFDSSRKSITKNSVRRLNESSGGSSVVTPEGKPIIHMYFEANPDWEGSEFGGAAEQEQMVQTWADIWIRAGWEPIILRLSDAQMHPYFFQFEDILDTMDIKYYDHICFHRWMAMVMAGGGWMADYDTYPLEMPAHKFQTLPNNGLFTAYDNNIEGGAIPSLLSGTANEWNRISNKLMQYASTHEGEFYNDMRALTEFNINEPNSIIVLNRVQAGIPESEDGNIDCEFLWRRNALAIHFSHRAQEDAFQGHFFDFADAQHPRALSRAYFVNQFRQKYNEECRPNHEIYRQIHPTSYQNRLEFNREMFPDWDETVAQ